MFFVTETKLDDTDIIEIDNYQFISKTRKQKYLRKSGGIGALIKTHIFKYVEVISSKSEYVLWLKIKNDYTNIGNDIIIGIVYIPPLHSRFFNEDEYDIFESEVASKCSDFEYVYICGDMNAQTADMLDYTEQDNF